MTASALDLTAVAAAWALAATFSIAAGAKLRAPTETTDDFVSLGLPIPAFWARAVPAMEIATAAALLIAPGWGGVAAFALLAAFTTNLVLVIRSGRVARCACFGRVSAAPVSTGHVVRNAVLLGLALLASTVDGWIWELAG